MGRFWCKKMLFARALGVAFSQSISRRTYVSQILTHDNSSFISLKNIFTYFITYLFI